MQPFTPASSRIDALDAIRGVALGGILLVNMGLFAFPALYIKPSAFWPGASSKLVEQLISFFAEGKFVSMFSFLFGLGFILFLQSAERKGLPPVRLFLRRLLVLLGIGWIHAHLIWFGDVLCFYSVLGILLLFFRKMSPPALLKWAVGLLVIPVFLYVTAGALVGPDFYKDSFSYTDAGYKAIEVYRSGTLRQLWQQNAADLVITRIGYLMETPMMLAMFLLGAYAGKRGIFRQPAAHAALVRKVQTWSALAGWPLVIAVALFGGGDPTTPAGGNMMMLDGYIASPLIGIFYIATLVRLLQRAQWQQWLRPFQSAGRMAATNYLLQSVICVCIYYSFGGGLYAYANPPMYLLIWVAVLGVQLAVSSWWMDHFRFGPVEWIWRKLTYGKAYAMKAE
ncbi:uncharacterized protein SAMN04488128_1011390 [Chitinophaga eiseniae]|uniref:DUF418 domain-containing protein n=1 Tax=Chitinophaga eiseniae TaxID=634771 RepID=A0A1T4N2Q3_9BACT|nr:DUF418 domain-containing protein [Chitinophaga eiseniae]SJZ73396.1 uncharacterized protein SAMN04488128_1011390 [Chitinophaga eiseniae]